MHTVIMKVKMFPTLSRKQSLSFVLASRISTSKKTTAFLVFLAGLRLAGAGGPGAGATAPFGAFLGCVASKAKVSILSVLFVHFL